MKGQAAHVRTMSLAFEQRVRTDQKRAEVPKIDGCIRILLVTVEAAGSGVASRFRTWNGNYPTSVLENMGTIQR